MYRRAEIVEHSARAACLDARAIHEAERGHFGRAAALHMRGDVQRAEAVGAAMMPHAHVHPGALAAGMAVGAMETAAVAGAVMTGAVVAGEIREAERMAAMGMVPGYCGDVYGRVGYPGAYYPPPPAAYVQPAPVMAYPPPACPYPSPAYNPYNPVGQPYAPGYPPTYYPPY